jgi:hypothetical protein
VTGYNDNVRTALDDARRLRDASSPVVAPSSEPEPVEVAAYDPSAHSVKKVLAYVDDHPDQAEAIAAAEAEGKARSSILSALSE